MRRSILIAAIAGMLNECQAPIAEAKPVVWLDEGIKIRRKPRKNKKKSARKGGRP